MNENVQNFFWNLHQESRKEPIMKFQPYDYVSPILHLDRNVYRCHEWTGKIKVPRSPEIPGSSDIIVEESLICARDLCDLFHLLTPPRIRLLINLNYRFPLKYPVYPFVVNIHSCYYWYGEHFGTFYPALIDFLKQGIEIPSTIHTYWVGVQVLNEESTDETSNCD